VWFLQFRPVSSRVLLEEPHRWKQEETDAEEEFADLFLPAGGLIVPTQNCAQEEAQ
jgi:hypothetical protein